MNNAKAQATTTATPPNYQPIQTVSQQLRPTTDSNRAVNKRPPTKRCKLYDSLGISRTEGSKLCAAIGLGSRHPLDGNAASCLSAIAKTYQVWKAAGHGIDYFISEYFN